MLSDRAKLHLSLTNAKGNGKVLFRQEGKLSRNLADAIGVSNGKADLSESKLVRPTSNNI